MKRLVGRILLWIGSLLVVALIVLAVGAWKLFGEFITAANSVQKLEDGLYTMTFEGDYGFDAFLAQGGAASDSELADYLVSFLSRGLIKRGSSLSSGAFGCSTICTADEDGTVFFGRNYDWAECQALIVHTRPRAGYASFSTCCLDFLGFGRYQPDGSMMERMQTLAAIYVPLDGMNEKGLVVADLLAGDKEETHQQTGKPALTTTTAIRLLLDKAANIEEALTLLGQYDMNSSVQLAHHLAMADATGRSVVVEYVDGKMLVTETSVVTNHYLSAGPKQGIGSRQSHLRYETLAAHSGPADAAQTMELLASVAQKNYEQTDGSYEKTMWSIVYCPEKQWADFCFAENYQHSYKLLLSGEGSSL